MKFVLTTAMVVRPLLLFALLAMVGVYGKATLVEYLPGYKNGREKLPFKLETGYIGVDTDEVHEKVHEDVQLFYYFVESQGSDPTKDPVLLWITGGPGCSSIRAFFFENGPLVIRNNTSSVPTLSENPNTWTTVLNIIYLDGPVGTGFSYSKTPQGYVSGDFIFADQTVKFLTKWLHEHPKFSETEFFLGGDGYTGNTIPIMLQNILLDNEDRSKSILNVKGYVLGNPGADFNVDFNSRIPFVHRMGYIPDKLFDEATKNCNGNYTNPPSCESDCNVEPIPTECACNCSMTAINKLIDNIDEENVLESNCRNVSELGMNSDESNSSPSRSLKNSKEFRHLPSDVILLPLPTKWCRKIYHRLIDIWAQNPEVQKALGVRVRVREGTKPSWESCNDTVSDIMYSKNVSSVVAYHQNLTNYNIRGLIYSGDHDLGIPSIGTQTWIWSLNLNISDHWRVWSVDDETVGFTRKFVKDGFHLTYATVRGAGHFAPENKPHVCSVMIKRWMANETL